MMTLCFQYGILVTLEGFLKMKFSGSGEKQGGPWGRLYIEKEDESVYVFDMAKEGQPPPAKNLRQTAPGLFLLAFPLKSGNI